jgi:hypothetical protein
MMIRSRTRFGNTFAKLKLRDGNAIPERHLVIAYLKYAVDDVALFNQTSATLLRQAIAYLEGGAVKAERLRPQ